MQEWAFLLAFLTAGIVRGYAVIRESHIHLQIPILFVRRGTSRAVATGNAFLSGKNSELVEEGYTLDYKRLLFPDVEPYLLALDLDLQKLVTAALQIRRE